MLDLLNTVSGLKTTRIFASQRPLQSEALSARLAASVCMTDVQSAVLDYVEWRQRGCRPMKMSFAMQVNIPTNHCSIHPNDGFMQVSWSGTMYCSAS